MKDEPDDLQKPVDSHLLLLVERALEQADCEQKRLLRERARRYVFRE